MKQSDIKVGQIYPIGSMRGQRGVRPTGMSGRVEKVGIPERSFSKRNNCVLVTLVDADGNDRLHDHSEWNVKYERAGKPIQRVFRSQEILDPGETEMKLELARQEEAAREARVSAMNELGAQTLKRIMDAMEISEDDVSVRVEWDYDADVPVVISVSFRGAHVMRRPGLHYRIDRCEGVSALLGALAG